MDADTAVGTVPSQRHRSLPQVHVDPEYYSGRPVPSIRSESTSLSGAQPEDPPPHAPAFKNLAASFPLFFFGAGCVAVALFVVLERSAAAIGRIPLWVPFVALGIIALAGGTLSVFAEPDEGEEFHAPKTAPAPSLSRIRRYIPPERTPPTRRPQGAVSGRPPPDSGRIRPMVPVPPSAETGDSWMPGTDSMDTRLTATNPAPVPPDDAASLLREIDLITAELRGARNSTRVGSPVPGPVGNVLAHESKSVTPTVLPSVVVKPPSAPSSTARPERLESEAPRQIAHCVGCGSAILHVGKPSRCQVCGEPLCSECRDRSFAEGKPNLCPLCILLDAVHTKGPEPARSPRPRT
jgi:hypothetical protein